MALFKGVKTTSRADKIEQITATVAEFGLAVGYLFGSSKLGSNLIEYSDFESVEMRTTTKSGKSKSTQIDYDYYAKIVLALGQGHENNQIGAVWVGGNRYDSLEALNSSGAEGSGLTFIPNGGKPYTQQYDDLSMCYGRCYLGRNSASVPSYEFEIKGLYRDNNGDANPADVIKFLLGEIGLNDYIDNTSWQDYKNFCTNAGLFISTPRDYFNSQKKAQEIIKELLDLTNTFMFWSVDKFKFIPCYPAQLGTWNPNLTIQYSLNENDFIKNSFSFKRKDTAQQYNIVKVNFTNRANDYEKESISFVNTADVERVGVKQTEVNAAWVHNKETAVKLAKMLAEKYANEITEYKFKLDWAYCRLEPGDLVNIGNQTLNIDEVVRISEVVEDKNGVVSITAISTPIENYGQAQYTVRNNYEYIDYNIIPGNVAVPLFVIPPSDLVTSNSGVELWIATRGSTTNYGGCVVKASYDDLAYAEAGTQVMESLFGTIISDSSTSMRVKLGNITQRELIPNQLVWVNGEVLSYETATLTAFNTYTLSGLQRGLHGTTQSTHAANEQFAVLDSSLFCVQLNKSDVGKTLYFKFPAFNIFKTMNEDINNLDSYSVVVNQADLPNCTNIVAYNKYRELSDDVTRYDIEVSWDIPNFDSYQQAQVWYKSNNGQVNDITIADGISISQMGYQGKWLFGGQGYNSVIIPQAVIGDTYQIAVCTQDIYGNVESPSSSAQVTITVATKTETPNTPANVKVKADYTLNISWDEVRNADIKYYEIRTDTQVGKESGLVGRTTELSFGTDMLTTRSGNIYVYSVSAYDKYSAPAIVGYNFPKPTQPYSPRCSDTLKGIGIQMQEIPPNCFAIHLYINDFMIELTTNNYSYSCNAGVYSVKYCFVDCFGEGTFSAEVITEVKAYIDSALIEAGSLTAEMLNSATQNALDKAVANVEEIQQLQNNLNTNYYTKSQTDDAIAEMTASFDTSGQLTNYYTKTQTSDYVRQQLTSYATTGALTSAIEQTSNSINTIVANLGKTPANSGYSAITQLDSAIGLKVSKGDVISSINLGNEGTVAIDGKYVHISGDTVFDNDVIIKGHMTSGSISCDDGVVINGGAVTINKNGINVTNVNGDNVILDDRGMRFADKNGNQYASVGRMIIGQASNGQKVTFKTPWGNSPYVLVMPQRFQTQAVGYSNVNLETVCVARDITNRGFQVLCYTQILGGTSGSSGGFAIGEKVYGFDGSNARVDVNTWYNEQIGTDKAITVQSGATEIDISVNSEYKPPFNYYGVVENENPYTVIGYHGSCYIKYEVFANNTLVATYNTPTETRNGYNSDENPTSSKYTIHATFPQNATLKIRATYYYLSTTRYYGYKGYAKADVSSYDYTVGEGSSYVVGRGKATFIALETLNSDYSLS